MIVATTLRRSIGLGEFPVLATPLQRLLVAVDDCADRYDGGDLDDAYRIATARMMANQIRRLPTIVGRAA
jgi:hypothetical protein